MPKKYKERNSEFEFDFEELQKKVTDYRNGINKDEIVLYFFDIMNNFIEEKIRHFQNNYTEADDMRQNIYLEIIEHLDEYEPITKDGRYQTPLTFFGCRITGVANKDWLPKHIPPHFNNIIRAVEGLCRECELPMSLDEVWIDKYSKILDIPAESVRKALSLKQINVCDLSVCENSISYEWSPEKHSIKQELKGDVEKALKQLTLIERYIFEEKYIYEKKDNDIRKEINSHKNYFKLTKDLSTSEFNNAVMSAKSKLMIMLESYESTNGYIKKPGIRLKKAKSPLYVEKNMNEQRDVMLAYLDSQV